ncbi:hypothetical protein IFM89_012984, partial [Coptis chinensis]
TSNGGASSSFALTRTNNGGVTSSFALTRTSNGGRSGGKDGVTLLWDLVKGRDCICLIFGGIIYALCFSPNRVFDLPSESNASNSSVCVSFSKFYLQKLCAEWAIVEMQGVVEVQPSFQDRLQNLEIGRLCHSSFQVKGIILSFVGYHECGSRMSLKKPLLVLKKKRDGDPSKLDEPTSSRVELEVIGIIRHRILFKTRPKALISNRRNDKKSDSRVSSGFFASTVNGRLPNIYGDSSNGHHNVVLLVSKDPENFREIAFRKFGELLKEESEVNEGVLVRDVGKEVKTVGQAFCAALQDEFSEYYKLLAVLEAQSMNHIRMVSEVVSSGNYLSLRRLSIWFAEPTVKMRLMAVLVDRSTITNEGKGWTDEFHCPVT